MLRRSVRAPKRWSFHSTADHHSEQETRTMRSSQHDHDSRIRRRTAHRAPALRRRGFRPRLEGLEERTLLSTVTVTNNDDSGPGSLRAAIAATSGETINFAKTLKGQTITLTSGPLKLGVNLTIDGLGADKLTVSGGGTEGVFVVSAGVTATIDKLTIANGEAVQGSGIDNFGTLTVDHCTLSDNQSQGGTGGGAILNEVGADLTVTGSSFASDIANAGPGADVFGGGILNEGAASVNGSVFTGNEALGGNGSDVFSGSVGGAIDNYAGATLTVRNSTFSNNQALGAAGAFFGIGGAIDNNNGSVATISNSTFTGNVAGGGAGCVANVRTDSASLRFFRQLIAQPTSSRTDSASLRL
jgi:hypothetical protein